MKYLKLTFQIIFIVFLFPLNSISQTVFAPEHIINDNSRGGYSAFEYIDLDNDGIEDILTQSYEKISWFKSRGNIDFSYEIPIYTGVNPELAIQELTTADFDMDGDIDIIFSSVYINNGTTLYHISLLKNNGFGSFLPPVQLVTDQNRSFNYLRTIDFDLDGDLDLVFRSSPDVFDSRIVWISNEGNGNFSSSIILKQIDGHAITDLELDDLDNDGDIDVAAIYSYSQALVTFENTGNNSLGSPNYIATDLLNVSALEIVHLNSDNRLDILCVARNSHKIYWFKNLPSSGFSNETIIVSNHLYPNIVTFDWDEDGDQDIITLSEHGKDLSLIKNNGFGQFSEPQYFITDHPTNIGQVKPIDIDNDGDYDILNNNGMISWAFNDGTDQFAPNINISNTPPDTPSCVSAGDLDGDGFKDIISTGIYNNQVSWYRNKGNGEFGNQAIINDQLEEPRFVEVIDYDHNGSLDLAVSTYSGHLYVYINDGTGKFTENLVDFNADQNYDFSKFKDIDGDGNLDIIANYADFEDATVSLFMNDGSNTFMPAYHLPGNFGSTIITKSADLDNDGDLDIVVAQNLTNAGLVWYQNDGNSNYDNYLVLEEALGYTISSLALVDLNGDNNLDILSGNTPGQIQWRANNGDESFSDGVIIATHGSSQIYKLDAKDLDNDGDLDLLTTARNEDKISWFEQLDNMNFGEEININTNVINPNYLFVEDLNNDNALDIISSSRGDNKIAWYQNLLYSPSVSGITYWDTNNNDSLDIFDLPLSQLVLLNHDELAYFTNPTTAEFQIYLGEGEYSLSSIPSENWTTYTPDYNIDITNDDHLIDYNFGFVPIDTIAELIGGIASNLTICDQNVPFYFNWENTGTTRLKGKIKITLDPTIGNVQFLNSPADSLVSLQEFYWFFDYLNPGQKIQKEVMLSIPGVGGSFMLGDSVHIHTEVEFESIFTTDPIYGIYEANYFPTILCSYDPNDKLVIPDREGNDNKTLFEEPLVYTIRFQNTGNYFATDVIIRDTLDENLNPSTFRVLASSHPDILKTTLSEQKHLTFSFLDIMLPDSSMSYAGSQGYVTYHIQTKENLDEGTIIKNIGHIYFDSNPAIVTNTTINTLTSFLNGNISNNSEGIIVLNQNPVFDNVIIKIKAEILEERYLIVFDSKGQQIYQNNIIGELELPSDGWSAGLYVISVFSKKNKILDSIKMVKLN